MNIIQWLLVGIPVILTIIFLGNAISALVTTKERHHLYPKWILVLSGFGTFFLIIISLILMLVLQTNQDELKDLKQGKPEYELVREPLYKIR